MSDVEAHGSDKSKTRVCLLTECIHPLYHLQLAERTERFLSVFA
jgi:hypothetical protein